ncbi:MAG: DUF11 domain-containing protein [Methanobrevibacter sp.]|nr:DUF11 domain-containing protein [Methanobrevibacter sp.]
MLKKIAISKQLLISLIFITLMFTAIGVNMEDSYAYDLNEDNADLGLELDDGDKLENSQENEVLSATYSLNGGTFDDIQNALNGAHDGDVIDLSGTFTPGTPGGTISVEKRVTLTSSSSATLNGEGNTQIILIRPAGVGATINNLKFINGFSNNEGGALRIYAKNVEVSDCQFENNFARSGSGAVHTSFAPRTAENLVVRNCQFTSNSAGNAAGALGAFAYNFLIDQCTFDSNYVSYITNCYGGAVQVGMDFDESYGVVQNCRFINNYAVSQNGVSHGGAGCVRNGTSYVNCVFINNAADHGGALTFHASGNLNNCEFYSNTATAYGGAVSIALEQNTMDLTVNDCTFNDNSAPLGGAMRLSGMNIEIKNSNYNNNYASEYGGAVAVDAVDVCVDGSTFNDNVANINGGAVYINGKNTEISNSYFIGNDAIPDVNKLNDGLGGAIYVNSTQATIKNNVLNLNTARNGSAVYYGKSGQSLRLENNVMYQNQAWVYALPVYAHDIYYGETEHIGSIIYGGNNIAKYNNLAVSNAIYNAAVNEHINIDGETPVSGATMDGRLYQDDREYNMNIHLKVTYQDGSVVYDNTLSSSYLGEVSDELNGLEPGTYYVTSTHDEDTYYKGITNSTSFRVIPKVDNAILKAAGQEEYNYGDKVIWTLTIANNGPNAATNVVVKDVLPDGLAYISSDGGNYNSRTGVLTFENLAVNEVRVVNILTEIRKTGTISNRASVSSDEYDIDSTNNQDDSTIYVKPASDMQITKLVSNSTPNYKDEITWSLVVKNNGPDKATGVKVYDILPKSLIWMSDNSDDKYNPETGLWNIGELANGGSVRLDIICQVNGTGLTANYANVTCEEYDYNPANNFDNKTIDVKPAADLAIEKLVNNSNPNYPELIKWTLIITNNGPDNATDVVISENIPEGLELVNYTASKGIYDNGIWAMCCLNVSEVQTLEIVCRINKTGNFTNIVSISAQQYDYNPKNNNANKSIEVPPASDLEVIKNVNNTNPDFGETVMWTIMVRNNGPDDATNVVVKDALSQMFIFTVYNSTKGDYSDGEWKIGSLNVGGVEYLNITGIVNAVGDISNYAEASCNEHDWNEANNYDSAFVEVEAIIDLAVEKFVNNSSPNYGDIITWTIVVTNNGPNVASNVRLEDSLPDGLTMLESSSDDYDGLFWNIGYLDAGSSESLEIICKVSATGDFINYAHVSGYEKDTDLSNNYDSEEIHVRPASDLSITKIASKYHYDINELVQYRIDVVNNGPDRAENIVVDEILGSSLSLMSFKASRGDFDEDSMIWSIDSLDYGESATLLIEAKANKEGISENKVSVSNDNYDPDLTNNEDNAVVEITNESQDNPIAPNNDEITKNVVKNKYHAKVAKEILERNVSGNSIFVLLISLIFTMVFLGKGISNRR